MKVYKIFVQGTFLILPGSGRSRVGAYYTFFARSASANSAVEIVKNTLINRLKHENIGVVNSGFFKTYFTIRNIWEVLDDHDSGGWSNCEGASFFKIGALDRLYMGFERILLKKSKHFISIDL